MIKNFDEFINENKLVHFQSDSKDNYYMLVDSTFKCKSAEEFCKKYIPSEYEAWGNDKFDYSKFKIYNVKNGLCEIPLGAGEKDVIDTTKMKMNVCVFSDNITFVK